MSVASRIAEAARQGIYQDISAKDYHADEESYSSTLIKKMDIPALAKHYMDEPQAYKDAYRIGHACHSWVLEREKFNSEFLTGISASRRSNADKESWGQWFTEHGADGQSIIENPAAQWNGLFEQQSGNRMVTPEEIQMIAAMSEAVMKNEIAADLLVRGKAEQSIYWRDDGFGLDLRIRPDYLSAECSDLKTIAAVDNYSIDRAIKNLGYDISCAMYEEGCQEVIGNYHPFLFIFAAKVPPYLVRVIGLSDEEKEIGRAKYLECKRRLAVCLDSGEWPGLPDDLDHTLFAPRGIF